MIGLDLCDPSWREFGASLRKNTLYVKMPLSKARKLIVNMELASFLSGDITEPGPAPSDEMLKFLREQFKAATNQSLFYAVPVADARRDVEALTLIEAKDKSEILRQFRSALEAGLNNDPRVDWIARTGGPKPEDSKGSEDPTVTPPDEDLFTT